MKRKADGSLDDGDNGSEGNGPMGMSYPINSTIPHEDSPDVATALSFPRLAKLRRDHNIQTEIAVHLSKLHHITKDHKGFYRVRICRTCSGLPHLLELGSYSDLESATLANDVHEFLNHRTRHLHVITEEDIKYIDQISVTRTWRHERTEVKLLELLQERLDKSKINQIRSQQHTGSFSYGPYGRLDIPGMDPSRGMMNQQMMGGSMPWPMQQQGMNPYMGQGAAPAGYMDQQTAAYMQQMQMQQQRMGQGAPGQPTPGSNQAGPPGSAGMPQTGMPHMVPGAAPQGISSAAQMNGGGMYGGSKGGISMSMGLGDDDDSDDDMGREEGGMDTPNLEKSAIAAMMGGFNPQIPPGMPGAPLDQISQKPAPNLAASVSIPGYQCVQPGPVGPAPAGFPTASAVNGPSVNGAKPPTASVPSGPAPGYMGNLPTQQRPMQQGSQLDSAGAQPSRPPQQQPPHSQPNAMSQQAPHQHHQQLPQQQQQQQQQVQQQQKHAQMNPMPQQGPHHPQHYPNPQSQSHPQSQSQQQQSSSAMGQQQGQNGQSSQQQQQLMQQQQMQAYYQQMMMQQQMMQQQMMQQHMQAGGDHSAAGQMAGYPSQQAMMAQYQHGAGQQQGYGAMDPSQYAAMHQNSNPLIASYNAAQANASRQGGYGNPMVQGYQGGKPGMVDPSGLQMTSMSAGSAMGANSSLTDLSEESIQRVTFMTYQFEGAKQLLFSKLSCACRVENIAYYINLIMDSLIALYVAPTYGNPIYAQNAMRAIEYVMNSGALTSGSLYLLVTAYTPGDMEATTEMIRNLHAALKEFETKYEQVECSTRRMNYYSTQLIGFFDQMRMFGRNIGHMVHPSQLLADPNAPRLASWEQMYVKILRCNHNFGLRCDLQLGLPVWWPNSVQPFSPVVTTPTGVTMTNFFKSENVIRGEYTAMRFNFGLVSELVEAYTNSGLEMIPERRPSNETDELDSSTLDDPTALGSQTLALLLIQYGCCTLAMEALELSDFSKCINRRGAANNSLSVNRFPIDREAVVSGDVGVPNTGIGETCGKPTKGVNNDCVEACVQEFAKWKKFLEYRIADPVVKGMFQNVYMDLLVMQIGCTAPTIEVKKEPASMPAFAAPAAFPANADDDASNILLELANSAKASNGGALAPLPGMVPPGRSSPTNTASSSNVFSSLLAAIDNVQPLQDQQNPANGVKDTGLATSAAILTRIDTNSPAIRDSFETIQRVIDDTLASGISGPLFQHPARNDTNKYAPHFSINHEISLRINMSYLSILALVSRRDQGGNSIAEASCASIMETLDAEAIVMSVYRELLFLGEWIDSSDGGCPLFSYTFFSFAICLKACKVLLTAYPSLAENLKKIMTLIPRILSCCGRRKTVCQILLHYQDDLQSAPTA